MNINKLEKSIFRFLPSISPTIKINNNIIPYENIVKYSSRQKIELAILN